MLAKLFKAFVGDKSASDIKEVQPVVDRVKEAEKSLGNLSADDLRGRSAAEVRALKAQINNFGQMPQQVRHPRHT